jgi:hypothetical protein
MQVLLPDLQFCTHVACNSSKVRSPCFVTVKQCFLCTTADKHRLLIMGAVLCCAVGLVDFMCSVSCDVRLLVLLLQCKAALLAATDDQQAQACHLLLVMAVLSLFVCPCDDGAEESTQAGLAPRLPLKTR